MKNNSNVLEKLHDIEQAIFYQQQAIDSSPSDNVYLPQWFLQSWHFSRPESNLSIQRH